jgi:hypothetical protein
MALSLLGADVSDADEVARTIARDAGGHPLFIAELAHTLRASGAEPEATGASLAELVSSRVQGLSERARDLLEVVAVAATPMPRNVLRHAARMRQADVDRSLETLSAARLAHSQGLRDDHVIDIRHDRIREIIVERLPEVRRRQHHLSLARALEAQSEPRAELLATHFDAGGEAAHAGRYWIAAADAAVKALAFARSATLYARGLARAVLSPADRRAVEVRMGEALAHAGQGAEAANVYLAAALTSARDEAIELRRRAAEQLFLSGHVERGMEAIERVLSATGMRRTRSGRAALLSVAVGRVLVRAKGLRPVQRAETELSREELARLDASWTIACSLGFIDFVRGADFQNKHMLLALRVGEPHRLLRALTLEAVHASAVGGRGDRRTQLLLRLAGELAARSPDEAAVSRVRLCHGIAHYLQGDVDAALAACEQALEALTTRCKGAIWEQLTAQRFVLAALFFSGRLGRLSEFVPPLVAEADATGNLYASNVLRSAYGVVAWLVRGDVEGARRQLLRARDEWTAPEYQIPHANLLIGETFVDLYAGDFERAHARIREQWPRLVAGQLLRIGVLRVQMLHLLGATAVAAASVCEARAQRSRAGQLRAEAGRTARMLRRDRIRRGEPLARLIDAAITAGDGDAPTACASLQACVDAFGAEGVRLFGAAARARLGVLRGGEQGGELVARAEDAFRQEQVADPARMIQLIAPGFGE